MSKMFNQREKIFQIFEQKRKAFFIYSILWTLGIGSAFVFGVIFLNLRFSTNLKINGQITVFILWLVVEVFATLVYLALLMISLFSLNYSWNAWKERLFYACISFNFYEIVNILIYSFSHHFFSWSHQKWTTYDFLIIALSYAVYLLLVLLFKQLLGMVPTVFLSFSFEYLTLFFVAYLTNSFAKTFLTGLLSGGSLLFFPSTFFINFFQFSFDYLIPNLMVSLATIVYFNQTKPSRSKWITFFILPYLGIYLSRVIGGVLFYQNFTYPGFPLFLYSLMINGLNTFFDFLCVGLIGEMIFLRLEVLKKRYDQKKKRYKMDYSIYK